MTSSHSAPHEEYIRRCIELARRALVTSDAPAGALVVLNDRIIAEGIECVRSRRDVTGHAEIEAVRAACERLDSLNLTGCTLYTSVEPCMMCAYATRLPRISRVVAGARSTDAACGLNGWRVLTSGDILPDRPPPSVIRDVLSRECDALLTEPPA
jgi:tRNA(adenine34) deaminase